MALRGGGYIAVADWVTAILFKRLDARLAAMEHRLKDTIVETGQNLQDKYDQLKAAVVMEIQQLKDAIGAASSLQQVVDTVVPDMDALITSLKADDPPPTP